MNKSKTCENCDNAAVCFLPAGQCNMWQPIPVATTHAPHTDTTAYDPLRELDDMRHKMANMNDAMAKRDDLIRRMAEWILRNRTPSTWTIPLTPGPYEIDVRRKIIFNGSNVLLSEANELMGVK